MKIVINDESWHFKLMEEVGYSPYEFESIGMYFLALLSIPIGAALAWEYSQVAVGIAIVWWLLQRGPRINMDVAVVSGFLLFGAVSGLCNFLTPSISFDSLGFEWPVYEISTLFVALIVLHFI